MALIGPVFFLLGNMDKIGRRSSLLKIRWILAMYSYLKSLYTDNSLPVKGIVLGLLFGLLIWLVLDYFLARSLDEILLQREKEQLQQKAASNRMLFHQYITQHVRLTKLFATHQPLVIWLQQRRASAQTSEMSRYVTPPPWFPPVSTWRGLIDPRHYLLHDGEGHLHTAYRVAESDLPVNSALQEILATGRSLGQACLVSMLGHSHMVTSAPIEDSRGRKLGILTLISRLDDEFVSKLNYAANNPNVILALFEGSGQRLLASNQPQLLSPGVRLENLQKDYLISGQSFFDYGSSELRLQLATLVPLNQVAELNENILDVAHNQHLVAAVAYTLAFTLLIFFWSRRIERLLRHIHGFSQHVLGASRAFSKRGDLLAQLERDVVRLTEEVLEARESLHHQHVMLQRLKQLEVLEAVTDHLGIGVVMLGPQGNVELQSLQVERFEARLGEGWYRPHLERSHQEREVVLKDEVQNQYTFNISHLSLFQQDHVVLIQEVTDQNRLQRRLRAQEEQFRHITNSARDAIISIDDNGIVVFWNLAAEAMFQYSASEIEGTPITRIMPAAYRGAHQLGMQRIVKASASYSLSKLLELKGLRKDGTIFPLEISLSTWQLEGARYFSGILRDITERKQVEQSLQESERYSRMLFEQSPIGLALCHLDGQLVDCNLAYAQIVGRTPDEMNHLSYWDVTPAEYAQDEQRQLESLHTTGCYGPYEKEYIHKEGRRVPVRLRGQLLNIGGEAFIWSSVEDISETYTAQRALQESQSRFALFMDQLPAAVLIKDSDSRVLYVNRYLKSHFGVGNWQGTNTCEHFTAEFNQQLIRDDRKVLAEGHYEIVEKLRDHAGQERTFRTHKFVIPPPKGEEVLLGSIAWDITERKRAEDSLRAQEEQLRLILASTGEGIFGLDMSGRCTFANRACVEMLGFAKEDDLYGKKMHELIHHTRHDGTNYPVKECPTFRSCTLRHVTFADDELLWRADGSAFHAEYQSYPMMSNDSVIGAVVSFSDITQRKQAEAALKQERDFAESLIETAPIIVLVLDPEGRIIRFNSFMEKLSGYALAEVKGQSWFDTFLVERDVQRVEEVFAKAKDGVQTSGNMNAILTRDGKEQLIAWYDTTLRDSNGKLTALLAIGHDVTEQKAKEAQLLQAQKMEIVGQLTGGMAHDFNNLLTVILGNLQLMAKVVGPECDSELLDLLDDSLSAAQDGAELTQRLLAISRKEPLQRKRIDLPAFFNHFQRFLRRTVGANITVQMDVEADLHFLLCDAVQLESALLNLALNARDAMPHGGRLCLRVAAKAAADLNLTLEPGTYVEIAVIDTGMGMSSEQLTRVIEPFYTTKGSGKGSGLGLSMVFGFCEHAAGRFRITSEQGVGTQAAIILPLNGSYGQEDTQSTLESIPSALTGKGTILVVEDEERVRKLARRYLEDLGYDVLIAENGQAAIESLYSESAIELVFSDVAMPGEINGCDLYRWVKEHRPQIKVLLTTGLRSRELRELTENDESPAPVALPKPYTKEQLAEAIRGILT